MDVVGLQSGTCKIYLKSKTFTLQGKLGSKERYKVYTSLEFHLNTLDTHGFVIVCYTLNFSFV